MKKEEKLQCKTARDLSIINYLSQIGLSPKRQNEKEAWYLSPFRQEESASLKVSKVLNRWYDHGAGNGGNIIDLVIAMKNNCSVREALMILNNVSSFSFQQQNSFVGMKPQNQIEIDRVISIKHPALIKYYTRRGISFSIVSKYAFEVHYSMRGKKYFAIGLQNKSGGWELRNQYYKNSSSPKDYTHISDSHRSLIITEGMFDFFTILTFNPALSRTNDFVILNSLAFLNRVIGILPQYSAIMLYLDNDTAGNKAVRKLCSARSDCLDLSHHYIYHKDINAWAMSQISKLSRKVQQ